MVALAGKHKFRSVGLFAGIGGFELGFAGAGGRAELLCEIEPAAQAVLRQRFPGVRLKGDIAKLRGIPEVEVIAGGFPCQDLSLVGANRGIHGLKSGLIRHVFRLIETRRPKLRWVVLENVPFMLWHKRGHAIRYVTRKLEKLGFRWAHRVVDSRAFGLPQRRRRVLIVASRYEDPRTVLFTDDAGPYIERERKNVPCGFYWTEGRAGLGWAINSTPTLKPGSSVGIPSPPGIWRPKSDDIVTPNVCDAERMQGFEAGWTDVEVDGKAVRLGARWRLVGNAVTAPVAQWLGSRLAEPGAPDDVAPSERWTGKTWPNAAWGENGKVYKVDISECPESRPVTGLDSFLEHQVKPLSARASAGFLKRANEGSLNFRPGFLEAVERHRDRMIAHEQ